MQLNQVTIVNMTLFPFFLSPQSSQVSPALGLAWASHVMVRLMMHRLQGTVARGDQRSSLRRVEVEFAPHLARGGQDVAVWREGVRGVAADQSSQGALT